MSALDMARKGFAKILNLAQEDVTIKSVTFARSAQDDLTTTTTNYPTVAKLNRGGYSDIDGDGGSLGDADLVMYFNYDIDSTVGLSVGNYITYNSLNFKIEKLSPYNLAAGLVYTKAYLKESNESI